MEEATKTTNDFFFLMDHFISGHSTLDIILCFWNFIGCMLICLLSVWAIHNLDEQRWSKPVDRVLVKSIMTLVCIGSFKHGIQINIPDLSDGLIFTAILLYLVIYWLQNKDKRNRTL